MKCTEASELLAAAVLGDLGRDEQRAVHTHLAGCERCLEEEQELFQTMHLLRARPGEEPGPDLHRSVMARAGRSGRMTRTLLTAAATVLVVLGLQAVIGSLPSNPAPPAQATVRSPHLLEGTLFDRQRNQPEEVKQFRKMRGDKS